MRGLTPSFFMEITIYTKPNCKFCKYLKQLLQRAELQWEEIECSGDNSKKLKEDYPGKNTYPFVIVDGEEIGGLVETAKFLLQKGLVSTKS